MPPMARRWVLGVAGLATLGVAAALHFASRHPAPRTRGTDQESPEPAVGGVRPPPAEPPAPRDVAELLVALRDGEVSAGDRAGVRKVMADWIARGPAAVGEIERLLESGADVALLDRWRFREEAGDPPSLRAAAILALAAIPGEESTAALSRAAGAARSAGEAWLAVAALRDRGRSGWGEAALTAAVGESPEGQDPYQARLIETASAEEPAAASRKLLADAPRDQDPRDPGALAKALRHMPWNDASRAATSLLEDPGVTLRAKRRYARSLLDRPEPEAIRFARDAWDRSGRSPEFAEEIADGLARSDAFEEDEALLRSATAEEGERIRARIRLRIEEARALLDGLFPDPEAAPNAAKKARKRIEQYAKRAGGR